MEKAPEVMSEEELVCALDETDADLAVLSTRRLRLIAALDKTGYAERVGARDTRQFLAYRYRLDHYRAHRDVQLARALPKYQAVSAQLDEVNLRPAQAEAIVLELEKTPSTVPVADLDFAERELSRLSHLPPAELRRAAVQARDILDTDGPEPEERKAAARESLTLCSVDRGVKFKGFLANENAELFRSLVTTGARPHKTVDGDPDPRSREKRQADALTTALTLAATALDAGIPSPTIPRPTTPTTPPPTTPTTGTAPTGAAPTGTPPPGAAAAGAAATGAAPAETPAAEPAAAEPAATAAGVSGAEVSGRTVSGAKALGVESVGGTGVTPTTSRAPVGEAVSVKPDGTAAPGSDPETTGAEATGVEAIGAAPVGAEPVGGKGMAPTTSRVPVGEAVSVEPDGTAAAGSGPEAIGAQALGVEALDIGPAGGTGVAPTASRAAVGEAVSVELDGTAGGSGPEEAGIGACREMVPGFGAKANITVTIDLNDLKAATADAIGQTVYSNGLSAAAIRRLACDANIIPIVLGSKSEPLDVGRCERLVTKGMRRALNTRDRGCVVCGAPPVMCDAHHLIHWIDGGITAISNLVLLCRRHHTDVHHGHWHITITDDTVHVTRPTWADPPLRVGPLPNASSIPVPPDDVDVGRSPTGDRQTDPQTDSQTDTLPQPRPAAARPAFDSGTDLQAQEARRAATYLAIWGEPLPPDHHTNPSARDLTPLPTDPWTETATPV